jgi:hypothetical protein
MSSHLSKARRLHRTVGQVDGLAAPVGARHKATLRGGHRHGVLPAVEQEWHNNSLTSGRDDENRERETEMG